MSHGGTMSRKQQFTLDESTPWKLWECEQGRRWSTRWDNTPQPGDVCNFSGCLPDHTIKLVNATLEPPFDWFKAWEPWETSPKYRSLT